MLSHEYFSAKQTKSLFNVGFNSFEALNTCAEKIKRTLPKDISPKQSELSKLWLIKILMAHNFWATDKIRIDLENFWKLLSRPL